MPQALRRFQGAGKRWRRPCPFGALDVRPPDGLVSRQVRAAKTAGDMFERLGQRQLLQDHDKCDRVAMRTAAKAVIAVLRTVGEDPHRNVHP